MFIVSHTELREAALGLLVSAGLPESQAEAAADGLVRADLRGVETHGVSNMLRLYLKWLADGSVNPHPDMRIAWTRGALTAIDSDRALGLAIMPGIVETTVEKAVTHGYAATAGLNGRHASSETRRVGKEGGRTGESRGAGEHK